MRPPPVRGSYYYSDFRQPSDSSEAVESGHFLNDEIQNSLCFVMGYEFNSINLMAAGFRREPPNADECRTCPICPEFPPDIAFF